MRGNRWWILPRRSFVDYSIFLMIFITLTWYNYTPLVIASQLLAAGCTIISRRFKEIHNSLYFLWWIVFCIFSLFTAMYTPTTSTVISMMISIIQVAVIGCTLVSYLSDFYCVEWTIKSILVSGVVLCLRLLITVPRSAWGTDRVGNYIGYGNDPAAIVLCFAALFLFTGYMLFNKKTYIPFAIIFCVISIFTGSRKGVIIVAVGLIVMMVLSKNSISNRIWTLCVVGALVLAFYIAIMNIPILYGILGSRLEALFYTLSQGHRNTTWNNSSEERILHMKYAFNFFKQNPIIGLGLDGYRSVCPIRYTYSHCNYTELLADMGIVGFLLYYSFPVFLLNKIIPSIKADRRIAYTAGILLAFGACDIALVSYMDETIHIYFAICVGMYYVLKNAPLDSVVKYSNYNQRDNKRFFV